MLTKFLDPKNDIAFWRIFGVERNKDILIHFLNDIFARTTNPIEEVTFLRTSQPPEIQAQRVSIVDILCQDARGCRWIIEMQVARELGFEKRAQYYAAKTYIEQREKDIHYQDLKEVTFLSIADFILFPEKIDYLSHHVILDHKTFEHDLKDFSFSFLELPKFTKNKDDLVTMTEKWAYFFKHASETTEAELTSIIGPDKILERAYDELDRYSWTAEELRTYDSIEMKKAADRAVQLGAFEEGLTKGEEIGLAKGEEIGLAKGEEIGEKRMQEQFVQRLHVQGVSVSDIAIYTGLSIVQIQQILTKNL